MAGLERADYSNFNPVRSRHRPADGALDTEEKLNSVFDVIWSDDPDSDWPTFDQLPPLDRRQTDPFRLRIQKMLTLALRQIHPDNGFACDLSDAKQIGRGRLIYGDEDPNVGLGMGEDVPEAILEDKPFVAILEEPFAFEQDLAPQEGVTATDPYEVIMQGWVTDNKDHPTDNAHFLLADVKRRLAALKEDERFPKRRVFRFGTPKNLVTSVTWDGGVVRPTETVSGYANFWMRATFGVSEDNWRPTE